MPGPPEDNRLFRDTTLKDVVEKYEDHSRANLGAGKLETEIAIYLFCKLANTNLSVACVWGAAADIVDNLQRDYLMIKKAEFKK